MLSTETLEGSQFKAMKAFSRRPRLPHSTPELDLLEVDWWNANAIHIERVWGLPDHLCHGARHRYIEDIREMFLLLTGARTIKVLEIACGSGWPGRLLASSAVKVTGVDFSEGQIEIARTKAAETGQTNCDYFQMDINQMSQTLQSRRFDGAFIHCGVHHLSTEELISFADVLALNPTGFPTILVEPVYLDQATLFGRLLEKTVTKLFYLLRRLYFGWSSRDEVIMRTTDHLSTLATENDWFFSPKEVPFDLNEIRRIFSPKFEVVEIVPVTYFGLLAAQDFATLKNQSADLKFALMILSALSLVDSLLSKAKFLSHLTDNYMFCRIVLIRR